MEITEYSWLIAILTISALYFFYLKRQNRKLFSETEKQYNELLTDDQYKINK